MTDIEQKALALVNEVARELGWVETKEIFAAGYTRNEALFRAIEQREAAKQARADRLLAMHALMAKTEEEREAANQELSDFKQKVSDAAAYVIKHLAAGHWAESILGDFIIPAPKPDSLVDVAKLMGYFNTAADAWADGVRVALEAHGLEIREKNDD